MREPLDVAVPRGYLALATLVVFAAAPSASASPAGEAPSATIGTITGSLWFHLLAGGGLVLVGICVQAIRTRPLRRRNAEIERALEERDQEIRRLSGELAAAHRLIDDAELAGSRFLANASHELRTPLNSILGFSELLLEGIGTLATDKQTRFLSNVRRSAQHLLSLINDVVDMSKVEAGRMEVHVDRLAIEPLVRSTIETLAGFAEPRRITITSAVDPELPLIIADATKVRQILYNMLSNALRFSLAGGSVSISVAMVELDASPLGADSIQIRVTDEGSGFPPETLEALMKERRLSAIASKLGLGAGLGLAIVKSFAEIQGGRLAIESRPGEGSTARVWLPLDAREYDTDKVSMKV